MEPPSVGRLASSPEKAVAQAGLGGLRGALALCRSLAT